jgi:hypothetical protein
MALIILFYPAGFDPYCIHADEYSQHEAPLSMSRHARLRECMCGVKAHRRRRQVCKIKGRYKPALFDRLLSL